MNLAEVHAKAVQLLTASPAVGGFAPFLIEDNVTNFEEQILEPLDKVGVCIVLGDIATAERSGASQGRRTLADVTLNVYVFDSPSAHHEPAGYTLVDRVIAALCQGVDTFQFQSAERGTDEKGASLTVLLLSAQVIFNP